MIEKLDIVLAGVGGQGTLVAGKVLGLVATELGLAVKVSEVHGMSQRGGSVITYVRMGHEVYSPVVEAGSADVILAFEELEALRWAHILRIGGVLLINSAERIKPMPVAMGQAAYPAAISDTLRQAVGARGTVKGFAASDLARQAGSIRAVNLVMLGALSRFLAIPEDLFIRAIAAVFPEKLRALNRRAFAAGSAIMEEKQAD
jgi:indolepyruvate ferredoxin oxidoreductase beta subunit